MAYINIEENVMTYTSPLQSMRQLKNTDGYKLKLELVDIHQPVAIIKPTV